MADSSSTTSVTQDDLAQLLSFFVSNSTHSGEWRNQACEDRPYITSLQTKLKGLFDLDYNTAIIHNTDGKYCDTYPEQIIILESQKSSSHFPKKVNEATLLEARIKDAFKSRVRQRFAVPVILVHDRNICRSSTLSQEAEVVLKNAKEYINGWVSGSDSADSPSTEIGFTSDNSADDWTTVDTWTSTPNSSSSDEETPTTSSSLTLMDIQRLADIRLLHCQNIGYIADLMVENKKKKFGFKVSSSEKADVHGRYQQAGFKLAAIPFPGVELFKEFKDNDYSLQNLKYDWSDSKATAKLDVPKGHRFDFNWEDYQDWNLVELTQHYVELLLRFLADNDNDQGEFMPGILVHCISGWDRTPLLISLLRLSLWADGEIHQSLDQNQILFLTICYDWFFFSHLYSDRATRGEDIFAFCFHFLLYLSGKEYTWHNACDCRQQDDDNTRPVVSELDSFALERSSNSQSSNSSTSSVNGYKGQHQNSSIVPKVENVMQIASDAKHKVYGLVNSDLGDGAQPRKQAYGLQSLDESDEIDDVQVQFNDSINFHEGSYHGEDVFEAAMQERGIRIGSKDSHESHDSQDTETSGPLQLVRAGDDEFDALFDMDEDEDMDMGMGMGMGNTSHENDVSAESVVVHRSESPVIIQNSWDGGGAEYFDAMMAQRGQQQQQEQEQEQEQQDQEQVNGDDGDCTPLGERRRKLKGLSEAFLTMYSELVLSKMEEPSPWTALLRMLPRIN